MKSTVEHLSPTRVRINVEVPFDELKPNFERAYKEIAQQVRIPGFRPGKVPARVLESRIGRGPILEEVVNDALPSKYMQAVETNEVRPLGQPEFEITKLEDGDEVAFSAAVDVRPELELPEFSSLSATVDSLEIADKDVQEELDNLRARFGTLVGVERPAAQGDFTNIDLKATVDGEPVEGADSEGMSYEVGSGDLIEGLDDALVGLSAGEQATFTTKLVGGEHAGKEAEVTVTLNSVKFRELPEADDEFAQMASEFDTIEELQADLRSKVENTKQVEQQRQARDKVLEALVGELEVPLPEAVLNTEIENRKRQFMQMFGQQEFNEATWQAVVQQMGEDAEGFEDNLKTSAEQNLRHQLVLDTIADREELSADDQEMTQHILYNAQRYGVSPEQYVQYAQNSGELGMIYGEIRRNKALQVVLEQATVTDAEGNAVNVSVLGGKSEEDDAEQAGTEGEDADASEQVEADSSEESSSAKS